MNIKRILGILSFIFWTTVAMNFSVLAQEIQAPQTDLETSLKSIAQLSNSDREMLGTAIGIPSTSDLNWNTIIAGVIFGSIGLVAFLYGKKNALWKPMVIGMLLIAYPYFISNMIVVYLVGIGLVVILYLWRD